MSTYTDDEAGREAQRLDELERLERATPALELTEEEAGVIRSALIVYRSEYSGIEPERTWEVAADIEERLGGRGIT